MTCRCGEADKPEHERNWIRHRWRQHAAYGKRILHATRDVVECNACGAVWPKRKQEQRAA